MLIQTLCDQFFYHVKIKRRSLNTVNCYDVSRRTPHWFLAQSEIAADTDVVGITHLRAFLVWLDSEGPGVGKVHAHARAIKAVVNWATKEEGSSWVSGS